MNRRQAAGLLTFLVLALAIALWGMVRQDPGLEDAGVLALPPLTLPADEAPHAYQTEWWYFNIHLSAGDQERYTLHFVTFQVTEGESGRVLYVSQAALGEAQSGSYVTGERVATSDRRGKSGPGFKLAVGTWAMEGDAGEYRLRADFRGVAFDLLLKGGGHPLLHGGDGLVDFGAAGVSYYYSRPRLTVSGTLTTGGQTISVQGLAWMDKQWGNFQPVAISWDWASIQLDSGASLMLTRLVDSGGKPLELYGTYRRADGTTRHLGGNDFDFQSVPGQTWESPQTGAVYPLQWRATLPREALDIVLEPLIAGSEYVSDVLGVAYWEAGVSVRGTQAGKPIGGQGFVELTGRDRSRE